MQSNETGKSQTGHTTENKCINQFTIVRIIDFPRFQDIGVGKKTITKLCDVRKLFRIKQCRSIENGWIRKR